MTNKARWPEASDKGKTDKMLSDVHAQEEERLRTEAVLMAGQGAWTRLESITSRRIIWRHILKMEQLLVPRKPRSAGAGDHWIRVCLSVCPSVCLSVCPSVCQHFRTLSIPC